MTERTYGTLHQEAGRWIVRCEPHVALKLKRVLAQVDRHQHGDIVITNNPANCRDLEWFVSRYPLAMEWEDRAALEQGAWAHRDHVVLLDRLIDPTYTPRAFPMARPAREYQRRAAEVFLAREFLLLGDDVGLGKTVSTICALTDQRTLPAVVVTKTILPRQWHDEIAEFAPGLSVHVVTHGRPYPLPRRGGRGPDVVVMSYSKIYDWAPVLAPYARTVAFDEIQELRRADSAKYRAAAHLASLATYRIGLSATPIYNYGGEIFNVFEVLQPGCLGTREEFMREWCTWGMADKARLKDPRAFGTFLREQVLMLRRTRSEVGRELPPITRITQRIDSDHAALDRVEKTVAELARRILAGVESFKGERMQAAGELDSVMRQATGVAKAPYVADFVSLLVESGERVVLFGWHREVYSIWADRLKEHNPVFITGAESTAQKLASKQAFIDGETPVLIVSLRSGEGMDGLQHVARTVVFGELDWAPGVHEQCIGRVARDGQPDPVTVYYLVSEDGADPIMSEVLGIKREQSEGIRSPDVAEPFERVEDGAQHAKRLAETFLARGGRKAREVAPC